MRSGKKLSACLMLERFDVATLFFSEFKSVILQDSDSSTADTGANRG
jgi:hypothetical protein